MTTLRAGEDHEGLVLGGGGVDARDDPAAVTDYCDARLEQSQFDDCRFTGLQLARARFDHGVIRRTTLQSIEGVNASFAGAALTDVVFRSSRLVGADFASSAMKGVVFDDCNLTLASFRFGRFTSATFRGCNLTEVDFQGLKATSVVFEECRMEATEFSQATFQNGSLSGCEVVSLSGVQFLAGLTIDEPALLALAPALAATLGIRMQW